MASHTSCTSNHGGRNNYTRSTAHFEDCEVYEINNSSITHYLIIIKYCHMCSMQSGKVLKTYFQSFLQVFAILLGKHNTVSVGLYRQYD